MPLNYSKWDNIELSDDEDNFHPNIDNNLMIRLQREKRQQREAEEAEKRKILEAEIKEKNSKEAAEELQKLDRMQKLHVGNISKDKFSSKHEKSKPSSSAEPSKTAESKVKVKSFEGEEFTDGSEEFLKQNKPILLEYAAIDEDDEASEQFVLKHTQLLSEHATGFYLLHCINLQAEGKTREMRKTARQYLLLTYVCDLAKSMPGRDARDAIKPLFQKMLSNPAAAQNFEEHLEKYIAHVKTRAEVKKQEMLEADDDESEYVPLKKGEHVGPGGLDPAEVFETLPQVMQDAFGERSIEALKQALQTLKPEDAQYHMKRCVDSGLWDPSGGGGGGDDDDDAPADVSDAASSSADAGTSKKSAEVDDD